MDYAKIYHIMVDASEKAISAIDHKNYGEAREILVMGEIQAENYYIENGKEEKAE